MKKKRVIIVGAGIAGITAGCYLQMNGYETEIFEAHNKAGGLCTSWTREGFQIEGCIHGLLGSAPTHPLYKLWNELIDMDQIRFIDEDIKHLYQFDDGKSFIQYSNLDLLQKSMIDIAPEDKEAIIEFIRDTKKIQSVQLAFDKPKEFLDLPGKFKMIKSVPMLPVIKKWVNVSSVEFSERFKNPILQNVTKHFSSPVLFEMFVLSEMDLKRCGYPAIGSLKLVKLFEKKYINMGGKVFYNNRVKKVVINDDNTAYGIELENDETHYANIIILAMDGKTAIYDFLDGKYLSKNVKKEYEKADINASKIQISLGINKKIEAWPHTVKFVLSSSLQLCDGSNYTSFDCQIYNDAQGLAPKGKTLVVIQLDTKVGEYWTDLRTNDMEKYKMEKSKIAEDLISFLDKRVVGFKDSVEMIDVTTPATYIRYTGNWRGSVQGWSNENIFKINPFKKQLPGLKNLFMIGQWVEPGGGVPNSFRSGRDVAQIICKKDNKRFMIK
jgi:phytoene dehydrogenase-like protein